MPPLSLPQPYEINLTLTSVALKLIASLPGALEPVLLQPVEEEGGGQQTLLSVLHKVCVCPPCPHIVHCLSTQRFLCLLSVHCHPLSLSYFPVLPSFQFVFVPVLPSFQFVFVPVLPSFKFVFVPVLPSFQFVFLPCAVILSACLTSLCCHPLSLSLSLCCHPSSLSFFPVLSSFPLVLLPCAVIL